jgi:hypothetical protein
VVPGKTKRLRRRLGLGILVGAIGCLPVAAGADAATRLASPGGVTSGDCITTPCDLNFAVEVVALPGDEVVAAPGTYDFGTDNLDINDLDLVIRGQAAQPRPLITFSNAPLYGISTHTDATLRDLAVTYSGNGYGIFLKPPTGSALGERLVVHATGGLGACELANAALRDSVCRSTNPGTDALSMTSTGWGANASASATNVTAHASTFTGTGTYGVRVSASTFGFNLIGKNVIASGPDADVSVETSGGAGVASLTLSFSNFLDLDVVDGPGLENPPDPPPAMNNQSASPLFANAGAGDFHQVAGSPTIDAGAGGAGVGTLDLDGQARVQGAAPDIGADEFVPPPATQPGQPGAIPQPPAKRKKCKPKKRRKLASASAKRKRKGCKKRKKKRAAGG